MKIIENRSTRILAFVAGEFDMTFVTDITIPLLKDVKSQAPNAVCDVATTNVNINLIVNQTSAPFNNPQIRKAMALALDRKAFNTDPGGRAGVARRRHAAGARRRMGHAAGGAGEAARLRRGPGEEPGRGAQDHGGARLRRRASRSR